MRRRSPIIAVLAVLGALLPASVRGEVPDFQTLPGRVIDLELSGRRYLSGVEVESVQQDGKGGLTELKLKRTEEPTVVTASQIMEILVNAEPWDVAYVADRKLLAHSPEERTARLAYESETAGRLAKSKKKLWPRLTATAVAKAMEEHHEHIAEVKKLFPKLNLNTYESPYFLVCSDLPEADVRKTLKALDSLYDELCEGFRIPTGKNIWYGKCIIHAFAAKESFLAWEEHYYKAGQTKAGGRAHWNYGTGRVIVSVYESKQFTNFVGLLTHETTHGFLHRYLSSAEIPKWLNEGVSDWAAESVVPQYDGPRKKQLQAVDYCRQNKTIPNGFFGEDIELGWRYGMGTNLAKFLSARDKDKYREFAVGIKEGYSPEESLQRSFGLSYADLLAAYGKKIGVSELKLATP